MTVTDTLPEAVPQPPPSIRTIQQTGPGSNRIDLFILGDGYTSAEISTTYQSHVDGFISYLFGGTALTDPFSRYQSFFNVFAVEVVSNQSGADDPSAGIVRDTALNASYRWDGVTQRLLYVDDQAADAVLNGAIVSAGVDAADMRFVTVNATQYGGGGGHLAVFAGGNASAHDVAVHEVGHSYAGLADEYGGFTGSYPYGEPSSPNLTLSSSGAKWSEWLGYVDPILGTVGAYPGGGYYDSGVYRPTLNSKMRVLNEPFDPIAREEFILRFYQNVRPLDGHDGNGAPRQNLSSLSVDTVDPAIIHVDWAVDGQTFADAGETFDLASHNFGFGTYTVTARAYDPTPWVRGDRSSLEQSVSWFITNDYRLAGGAANDALVGNDNAQAILGFEGNDVLNGKAGADTLDGGAGADAASYANASAAVLASLATPSSNTGEAQGDAYVSIEGLVGSGYADTLSGDGVANTLRGSAGRDLLGGAAGNDWLVGGYDSDTLQGGAGSDRLEGGVGNDVYDGVDATDVVVEASSGGVDKVVTSASLTLPSEVENLELTGSLGIGGTGNGLGNVIAGNSAGNVLRGAGGADSLSGAGGADTLYGGYGYDTLVGGPGADIFAYNAAGESIPGTADRIKDFQTGDRIHMRPIDANVQVAGDQAFILDPLGGAAATIGHIRQYMSGSSLVLDFNTDADSEVEMRIVVLDHGALAATDFVL